MSESVLDFASLDAVGSEATAVETQTTETPIVETPSTETTTTTEIPTTETKTEKAQYNSDGTPVEKTETKAEDLPGDEKTPKEIRAALKAFRDASPANAGMTKTLHGAWERWEAAKQIFPGGVNEMKQIKEFSDLVGGVEGYEALTSTKAAAEASDAKLYDPAQNASLIEDVVEDLKQQGKLGNLKNLSTALLEATKINAEADYKTLIEPHALSIMETANMPGVLSAFAKIFTDPNLTSADPAVKATAQGKALEVAKAISDDMGGWYKNLAEKNKQAKAAEVSPERQKLEEDRKAFLQQQEDFKSNQSTEFKNSVAKVCESHNNKLLGAELAPFLKMAFFKGYGRENLMPLGNTLKSNLYAALKADNAYQLQMKSMWGAKTPDRQKIEEYHQARVASIARNIVSDTIQKMYPGYAKGGAAAGRVAAATDKKVAETKVVTEAQATGKPIYVATKPSRESMDLDHLDAKGRPDGEMNLILGRAYLKPTVKGGPQKFVTWRR
jgi:hypothetical protein